MRTKVAVASALDRVLDALAEDLLAASDEEILAVARELGMDPSMRGSAAFFGLKYPFVGDPASFFADFDEWRKSLAKQGIMPALGTEPKRRTD